MMGAGNTRGIGRYIEETVRAVLEVDHELKYALVVRRMIDSPFVGHPRVEHVVADIPWYSVSEQMKMAGILEGIGADLIHIPHWNVPLLLRKPFVITVHDLLLLQQVASSKTSTKGFLTRYAKYAAFRFGLRQALKRAKRIFVPIPFVAREVEIIGMVERDRIQVTGEGVSKFPSSNVSLVPDSPFLLYVGSAYPHKRLDLLMTAWAEVAAKHPRHMLIIAGEMDVFMKRMVEQISRSQAKERVRFLGRVTDAQLRGLYEAAEAFVFPSSHEGFGLPPLEALSLGCPVVVSDIPSLREVLPSQGVEWFREGDHHGIMYALESVLRNSLSIKQQVSAIKHDLCLRHDWRKSAQEVIKGYRMTIE